MRRKQPTTLRAALPSHHFSNGSENQLGVDESQSGVFVFSWQHENNVPDAAIIGNGFFDAKAVLLHWALLFDPKPQ